MLIWYSTGWIVYMNEYTAWKKVMKNIDKVKFDRRMIHDRFKFNIHSDSSIIATISLYDDNTFFIDDKISGDVYSSPDTYYFFNHKIKKTLKSMIPEEYKAKPKKKETFLDYL